PVSGTGFGDGVWVWGGIAGGGGIGRSAGPVRVLAAGSGSSLPERPPSQKPAATPKAIASPTIATSRRWPSDRNCAIPATMGRTIAGIGMSLVVVGFGGAGSGARRVSCCPGAARVVALLPPPATSVGSEDSGHSVAAGGPDATAMRRD